MPEFQLFDNEVIVYQQGSGLTHLVNLFGSEILNLLFVKPRTIQEITEILIESSEGIEKHKLDKYVQQFLDHCLLLEIVNFHCNEN